MSLCCCSNDSTQRSHRLVASGSAVWSHPGQKLRFASLEVSRACFPSEINAGSSPREFTASAQIWQMTIRTISCLLPRPSAPLLSSSTIQTDKHANNRWVVSVATSSFSRLLAGKNTTRKDLRDFCGKYLLSVHRRPPERQTVCFVFFCLVEIETEESRRRLFQMSDCKQQRGLRFSSPSCEWKVWLNFSTSKVLLKYVLSTFMQYLHSACQQVLLSGLFSFPHLLL